MMTKNIIRLFYWLFSSVFFLRGICRAKDIQHNSDYVIYNDIGRKKSSHDVYCFKLLLALYASTYVLLPIQNPSNGIWQDALQHVLHVYRPRWRAQRARQN